MTFGNQQGGFSDEQDTIHVEFVNNDGGGFADYTPIRKGTNIAKFFREQMPEGSRTQNYRISVNGRQVASTYELQNGDKISITPLKIEGA